MDRDLLELVQASQNNEDAALLQLFVIFKPSIKKFSRQLHYEEAETDLIIAFIEIVKKTNLNEFNNQKLLFGYIYRSLLNKKCDLYRQRKYLCEIEIVEIDDFNKIQSPETNIESCLFMRLLLQQLPLKQRKVLVDRYIKGYGDIEIARNLNISRQAVNKLKNKGLSNIKQNLRMN